MKKLIGVFLLLSLGACSSVKYSDVNAPRQKFLLDSTVQALSRNEVIDAANQCTAGYLRPTMVYAKRKIGDSEMTSDIIVEVMCTPRY